MYYIPDSVPKTTCIGNTLSTFNISFSTLDTKLYTLSTYSVNSVNYLSSTMVSVSSTLNSRVNFLSSTMVSVSSDLRTQLLATSSDLFTRIQVASSDLGTQIFTTSSELLNTVQSMSADLIFLSTTQGNLVCPNEGEEFVWNTVVDGVNGYLELSANIRIGNPIGLYAGQTGSLIVQGSDVGGHDITSYGSLWAFPNGLSSINTEASAKNLFRYYFDGSEILTNVLTGFPIRDTSVLYYFPSFNWEADSSLTNLADNYILPDGQQIVVGKFTTVDGYSRQGMVKLRANGPLIHSTSVSYINNSIYAIEPLGSKLIIGGGFTLFNSQSRPYLALIDENFVLDSRSFPVPDDSVYDIATNGTDVIYAGGNFTKIGASTTYAKIAAFNVTGGAITLRSGFDVPSLGAGEYISRIRYFNDRLFIGGSFSGGTTTRRSIMEINTSTGDTITTFDASLTPSVVYTCGINDFDFSLDELSMYIVGYISKGTTAGTVRGIMKLDIASPSYVDGTMDMTFDGNLPYSHIGDSLDFTTIKVIRTGTHAGKILVAKNKVSRLNIDGTLDDTFNAGSTTPGYIVFNDLIGTIEIDVNENIIIGGEFTQVQNEAGSYVSRPYYAMYDMDGTLLPT